MIRTVLVDGRPVARTGGEFTRLTGRRDPRTAGRWHRLRPDLPDAGKRAPRCGPLRRTDG